jgi:hypothetical protein
MEFSNLTADELEAFCADNDVSPDTLTATLQGEDGYGAHEVQVYDDGAPGWGYSWYLCGHEFGPTFLIRADNESSAYEIWIDESPTIEVDDVPEAYGAFDKLVEHMEKLGHENDYPLRDFANRWNPWFFQVSTHNANYTGAWDSWNLDEGYQYQSNASGTGIVSVGHYEWMRSLVGSGYEVRFSGVAS